MREGTATAPFIHCFPPGAVVQPGVSEHPLMVTPYDQWGPGGSGSQRWIIRGRFLGWVYVLQVMAWGDTTAPQEGHTVGIAYGDHSHIPSLKHKMLFPLQRFGCMCCPLPHTQSLAFKFFVDYSYLLGLRFSNFLWNFVLHGFTRI